MAVIQCENSAKTKNVSNHWVAEGKRKGKKKADRINQDAAEVITEVWSVGFASMTWKG